MMELMSLRKLLLELQEKGLAIGTLVTDRSISVRYYILTELNSTVNIN